MPAEKSKRKFFELRNGLKAVDFRNKDYFDRIDDHEKSLYSPYMLMRYVSSVSSKDTFYVEHYVEMVNECVNKHCFTLGSKHKKLFIFWFQYAAFLYAVVPPITVFYLCKLNTKKMPWLLQRCLYGFAKQ